MDTFLVFTLLLSILVRWSVSRWPYSGSGKPPMYGDYEAQRHWQEITINVPISDWYKNTSNNDLNYWGLDYPPLTAYHSYVNGKISQAINPSWVTLHKSRGMESYGHKLFMRATVLFSDVSVYIPAMIWFWYKSMPSGSDPKVDTERQVSIAITTTLLYPGLILIDHGHFQYNCISLGLTLIAITFLLQANTNKHLSFASLFFVLALNYKQMSLYHSIPFFCYILASVIRRGNVQERIKSFSIVGITVIATFVICWSPFLIPSSSSTILENLSNVSRRLFPFNRGLYEDKVANFWCVIELVVKLRKYLAVESLVRMSSVVTLLSVIPSGLSLILSPSFDSFKYNLSISSLGFFLFSFQVHEKSILLAALPILILMDQHPLMVLWFSIISTFSLQPLLIKDGLLIPSIALLVLFSVVFISLHGDLGLVSNNRCPRGKLTTVMFISSMYGCIILTIVPQLVQPPSRYPDLWTVLNCAYSFVHFMTLYVYLNCQQISKLNELLEKVVTKTSHVLFCSKSNTKVSNSTNGVRRKKLEPEKVD